MCATCTVSYKLAINVTAACGRGCSASVGLLVTEQKTEQKKGQKIKKNTVDEDTENKKVM